MIKESYYYHSTERNSTVLSRRRRQCYARNTTQRSAIRIVRHAAGADQSTTDKTISRDRHHARWIRRDTTSAALCWCPSNTSTIQRSLDAGCDVTLFARASAITIC